MKPNWRSQVLFHAAPTPKSDTVSGGVDDLNPIELNKNGVGTFFNEKKNFFTGKSQPSDF
jgi:hypothetical protein